MLQVFAETFAVTGFILAGVAGVVAALAVCGVAVLIILALLAASFDRLTDRIAKHWQRRGKEPQGRIARIIYAGRSNHV